jgi:hypothetical protein
VDPLPTQAAKPLWHIDVQGDLQLSAEEFAHAEGLAERLDQVPARDAVWLA